jgi:hypothetical protein
MPRVSSLSNSDQGSFTGWSGLSSSQISQAACLALLTGGIGVVLLGLWERKHGQLTFRHYVALVIIALLPAAYQSWFDEHQLRTDAERKIETFDNRMNQRRELVRSTLRRFYNEAQSLLWEKVTADSFADWGQREIHFGEQAGQWITKNMGEASRAKFEDMSGLGLNFDGSLSSQHLQARNWLNKVSRNLQDLQRPEWDGNAPRKP